jgi:hypothetical protein
VRIPSCAVFVERMMHTFLEVTCINGHAGCMADAINTDQSQLVNVKSRGSHNILSFKQWFSC